MSKLFISRRLILALGVDGLFSAVALANAVRVPKGPVILRVTGNLKSQSKNAREYEWDMSMLERLPQHTFTTLTPWSHDRVTFSGPLLRDVLDVMRAEGDVIKARALNDYVVSIPLQDAYKFDMIIAVRMNGAYMPVRQRGPLFVIYPFDSKPELSSSTYYERSIWQLSSMAIQ